MTYYHGGVAGLSVGDELVPSPPHVSDGCPVCVARAAGRVCTVAEYRRWARRLGEPGRKILEVLAGAPDDAPVDPPSERRAVYFTSSIDYATWYAARSRGDLYAVEPLGLIEHSPEDNFPTWTTPKARVVAVVRRAVVLTRRERRRIDRLWGKADRRRDRAERQASAA